MRELSNGLKTLNVRIQIRNDANSFPHPTCCLRTGVSGVLAAVAVSPLGCQFHDGRERTVTDPVSSRDFHQVDAPRLQLLQESHRMGPWRRKQAKKLIFKGVQLKRVTNESSLTLPLHYLPSTSQPSFLRGVQDGIVGDHSIGLLRLPPGHQGGVVLDQRHSHPSRRLLWRCAHGNLVS